MNILVLTNIYPAPDMEAENTPVVHYFTREWVKQGHNVIVIHYPANFPQIMMWGASLFKKQLAWLLGIPIRTWKATNTEFELDNVRVKRIPLTKYWYHGKFSRWNLNRAYEQTKEYLKKENFTPDVVTSHWVNPQLEMMERLSKEYKARTCYVAHVTPREFHYLYSKEKTQQFISSFDVMGFRSKVIRDSFHKIYSLPKKTFLCYSGIPKEYISATQMKRDFSDIRKFIFTGMLIKRKYPVKVIEALAEAYGEECFSMTYLGQGREERNIRRRASELGVGSSVHLLGKVQREEVARQLSECDVFVMISLDETYGLVYLEAMSQGCITIASRNEGFDGIIEHGLNGFLCEAGNAKELAQLIKAIRQMPEEQLQAISTEAIRTAERMTDAKVAEAYAKALS